MLLAMLRSMIKTGLPLAQAEEMAVVSQSQRQRLRSQARFEFEERHIEEFLQLAALAMQHLIL